MRIGTARIFSQTRVSSLLPLLYFHLDTCRLCTSSESKCLLPVRILEFLKFLTFLDIPPSFETGYGVPGPMDIHTRLCRRSGNIKPRSRRSFAPEIVLDSVNSPLRRRSSNRRETVVVRTILLPSPSHRSFDKSCRNNIVNASMQASEIDDERTSGLLREMIDAVDAVNKYEQVRTTCISLQHLVRTPPCAKAKFRGQTR